MRRAGWVSFVALGLFLVGCNKDKDGDGFKNKEDCDDGDAGVNPDADEICDGVDNNCNGSVDEGLVLPWYADADGDLYGDEEATVEACNQPEGFVNNMDDCDDSNEMVHPLALEADCEDPVDYNCDGSTQYEDLDGDGAAACETDCDDTDPDVLGASTWYIDYDNDGYGSPYYTQLSCEDEIGWVNNADDCDDLKAGVNPETIWYTDADGDGYGDEDTAVAQCEAPSETAVRNADDCDDTDAQVNPDTLWFEDLDGDGYGNPGEYQTGCERPDDHAPNADDCDDGNADISPDASEVCDVVDNDCDGGVDEDDALDARTFYVDADDDGYGDDETTTISCWAPSGYSEVAGDCDDALAEVNPGMEEVCDDGLDNNCVDDSGQCELDLAGADAVFVGGSAGDEAAVALSGLGDVNADGMADFVIGVKHESTELDKAGAAYVIYGSPDLNDIGTIALSIAEEGEGGSDTGSEPEPEVEMTELRGIELTDKAGRMVFGPGDVSNDAVPDVIVAAPVADPNGANSGQVYIVFGQSGGIPSGSLADADVTFNGRTAENYAGFGLASGDLDNDGAIDVLIGATGNDVGGPNAGTIYVLNGPTDGDSWDALYEASEVEDYVTGEDDYYAIGSIMDSADLDGDGFAELVVGDGDNSGASLSAGRVHILSGPVTGAMTLADSDVQFDGESSADKFGTAVVVANDVDGDGNLDLLASAVYDDVGGIDAGAAYVIPYSPESEGGSVADAYMLKMYGESASDGFGAHLAAGGDVDGDGLDDFLVTSPAHSGAAAETGAVYVFYAGASGAVTPDSPASVDAADADVKFEGDDVDDRAGNDVDFVGDIAGTELYDALLIGSTWDDSGGENAGAAYLIHGVGL